MTIHLPPDLERFIHDQVLAGRYPSEDDVIRDALEQLRRHAPSLMPSLGSIGAMHDDAELLEQVTQDIPARPSRNRMTALVNDERRNFGASTTSESIRR